MARAQSREPARAGKSARADGAVPSRGRYVGTGSGPALQPIDIGHPDYVALIEPDTAFWALVRRAELAEKAAGWPPGQGLSPEGGPVRPGDPRPALRSDAFGRLFQSDRALQLELRLLLYPGEDAPPGTAHVPRQASASPGDSQGVFPTTRAQKTLPQIIFHGAEPLLNREAVFAGIEQYAGDFRFGIQTNATLLDDAAIAFLRRHQVSVGISWTRHGHGRRPHAEELGRPRHLPAGGRRHGSPQGLSGLERDLHHIQREPAAVEPIGRLPPRARGADVPDEHPPLHAAAVAERQARRRAGGQVLPPGAGSHLRPVSEDGAQVDRGQLRQHPAGDCRPRGAAADVRHFPLRRRPVLLRPGSRRRHVPVQRVHRPGLTSAAATSSATTSRPCCKASRSSWSRAARSTRSSLAATARSGTSAARPVRPRPTR